MNNKTQLFIIFCKGSDVEPEIEIPDISKIVDKIHLDKNTDERLGIEMSEVAKVAKEMKGLSIDDIPDPTVSMFYGWTLEMIISVSVLAAGQLITTGLLVLVIVRQRWLFSSLLLIQNRGVKAFVVTPATATTTVEPYKISDEHLFYLDYALKISAGYLVLLLAITKSGHAWNSIKYHCRLLYRLMPSLCSPPQAHQFIKMYLKVSSPESSQILYLLNIPFEHGATTLIDYPIVDTATVVGLLLRDKLSLKWHGKFTFARNDTETFNIEPPHVVSVPFTLRNALRKNLCAEHSINFTVLYRITSTEELLPVARILREGLTQQQCDLLDNIIQPDQFTENHDFSPLIASTPGPSIFRENNNRHNLSNIVLSSAPPDYIEHVAPV